MKTIVTIKKTASLNVKTALKAGGYGPANHNRKLVALRA
jgi:hypothetical protein